MRRKDLPLLLKPFLKTKFRLKRELLELLLLRARLNARSLTVLNKRWLHMLRLLTIHPPQALHLPLQPPPQLERREDLTIITTRESKFTNSKNKLSLRESLTPDLGKSSKGLDMSTEQESFTTNDKSINTLLPSLTTDTCGINIEQESKN